jgi:putative redox protein
MPDPVNAEAVWQEDLRFVGTSGSGHEIVLDASDEFGGKNAGPRPIELLLVGLAGCTGMDVVSILNKMRQPLTGYRVRVTGQRADTEPHVYTYILVEHILQGDLDEAKVAHAVELSDTKYCSAAATLKGVAKLEMKWTIEKP